MYSGYTRIEETTDCYKQIKGSYLKLADGIDDCNRMKKKCNGVQYMKCKNGKPKITKSLFKTKCQSEYNYAPCYVVQFIKIGKDQRKYSQGIFILTH